MTVSTTQIRANYSGDGTSVNFPIPFPFYLATDLLVLLAGSTITSGYSVSGGNGSTGTLTMATPPASNVVLQIILNVPLTQLVNLVDGNQFPSATLNQVNDRAIQAALRMSDLVSRSLRAPDGDTSPGMLLPAAASRAGMFLTFDGSGNALLASAGPGTQNTQATLGPIMNPQTAAEIAAAVTPSNFAFQTFDVSRMGAIGDGSTDNTTALQNILNVARVGRIHVHAPSQNRNGQTVYVTGPLTVYEGTYFTADPGVIIQSNNTNANLQIFQCAATLGSATNLSANATIGANTVTVGSSAGLAAGQVVKITDSAFLVGSVPNFEHNEILSVAGNTVTLKQALIGNYNTANTAQLIPHSAPARHIHFENVKVLIPTTADGGSFYFQDAYNCSIRNCESQGQKGQPAVQIWRSAYVRIYGGSYRDGQNQPTPGQGYGGSIAQGSHGCFFHGTEFRNVRECAVSLGARYSGYIDCVSYTPYDNGFNGHATGSFDCFFINCRTIGAGGTTTKGFYAGNNDTRIVFRGCKAYNVSAQGFWLDSGTVDATVEGCQAWNCNTVSGGLNYPFYTENASGLTVRDCVADAGGNTNVRALLYLRTGTNVIARGNRLRNAPTGWGIIHSACAGVQIDDNLITGISAASQGVFNEGSVSTGMFARRNKVDNNTPFAVNTGDICEWNEYSSTRQNSRGKTSGNIADGGTINHGCVTTPYRVSVTSLGSNGTDIVKVSAVSSTQITVSIKTTGGASGSACPIMWEADS